jgi:FecR protein/Bacterial Ig-like domain (group 2)
MKALSSLLLVLAICIATIVPSSAAADNELTNVFGDVTYQLGTASPTPIAKNVSVALATSAYAITGASSQAKITLPDSSEVQVGANTKVQLASFDTAPGITNASFVLIGGKTRFNVRHPGGAKANYTFTTSTGQIAVRGTEGDISVDPTQMQVNVYQLGDPNLPVVVTLNNGKTYTLTAGQALVVGITGAVIAAAAVSAVTSPLTSTFAEFGAPANSAGAAGAVGAAGAAGAAGVAPAAIAAAAAAAVVGGVVAGSTHNGTTPSAPFNPTPTPQPTTKPTAPPGDVVVTPRDISLAKTGATANFTASQRHSDDSFTASSDNTSIATVAAQSASAFTVTAAGPGTAHITVTGENNKSAVVTVNSASGTISPSTANLPTLKNVGATGQFSVSESGYSGSFNATTGDPTVATVASGGGSSARRGHASSSQTFTVTAVGSGTTQISVSDSNGNTMTPPVGVTVVAGPINLSPTSLTFKKAFGEMQTFTANEKAFSGAFAATSNNPNVTVTPSSSQGLFTVTSVANGTSTITVTDGLGHSSPLLVTVSSPSPAPSTTCVPIIIQGRHRPDGASAPCPSATPSSPPTTRNVQKPHPVALPPGKPAKPEPRRSSNPMHPMQPLTGPNGMLTPPPLPIPPGGGPP